MEKIILTILDCCALPSLYLIAYCIVVSAVNSNPVIINSAVHLITEIYEIK